MDSSVEDKSNQGSKVPNRLLTLAAVYFWRRGQWYFRKDLDGKTRPMSPLMFSRFEELRQAGSVTEKTPGYFRSTTAPVKPIQNDLESPLARLAQIKNLDGTTYIDVQQHASGEKLRWDYERACMASRTTINYDQASVSPGGHWQMSDNGVARMTDNAIAARQRLHLALDAVGPELSGVLYYVCCLAGGIEQAELRLELPRRSGKAILALALTRLARHYGLKPSLKHAGPSQIGHWATPDFKPQIFPQVLHQP